MFEDFFSFMSVFVLALFGILTLGLGGAITIVVGRGWILLTFRRHPRQQNPAGTPERTPVEVT